MLSLHPLPLIAEVGPVQLHLARALLNRALPGLGAGVALADLGGYSLLRVDLALQPVAGLLQECQLPLSPLEVARLLLLLLRGLDDLVLHPLVEGHELLTVRQDLGVGAVHFPALLGEGLRLLVDAIEIVVLSRVAGGGAPVRSIRN